MLPVQGNKSVDFLAVLLESWALAFAVAVHNRQPNKYLRPYVKLIEWGSEPNSLYVDSFRHPSRVLAEWLESGITPGNGNPVVNEPGRPARLKGVIALLREEIDNYKRKAETDRQRDRTPRNAWLGVADIIYKALNEIVSCLEGEEEGGPQL